MSPGRRARLRALGRHTVVQNALALYAYQFAITVLPLITLPFVARALGPGELADVVLAQSAAWVLSLVVSYAFELSATRDVARAQDDPERLTGLLRDVHGAKLLLALAAALLALVLAVAVPQFRAEPHLPAFALTLAVLWGFQPGWFLAGVERLRATAAVDIVVMVANAAAIVLLVRDRDDGWIVLTVWATGALVTLVAKLALAGRIAPLGRPRFGASAQAALRRGVHLFTTNVAQAGFTVGNVLLLGLLVPGAQVAFFASAERVVRAASRFVPAIATAVFPRVNALLAQGAERRADRLAWGTVALLGGLGVLAAGALALVAEPVVRLVFGDAFAPSVPVLRVLALVLPLTAVSTALSTQVLIPRGRDRAVSRVVLLAAALNVGLAVVIVPGGGVQAMAWLVVGVEAFVAVAYAALLVHAGARPRAAAGRPAAPVGGP